MSEYYGRTISLCDDEGRYSFGWINATVFFAVRLVVNKIKVLMSIGDVLKVECDAHTAGAGRPVTCIELDLVCDNLNLGLSDYIVEEKYCIALRDLGVKERQRVRIVI